MLRIIANAAICLKTSFCKVNQLQGRCFGPAQTFYQYLSQFLKFVNFLTQQQIVFQKGNNEQIFHTICMIIWTSCTPDTLSNATVGIGPISVVARKPCYIHTKIQCVCACINSAFGSHEFIVFVQIHIIMNCFIKIFMYMTNQRIFLKEKHHDELNYNLCQCIAVLNRIHLLLKYQDSVAVMC